VTKAGPAPKFNKESIIKTSPIEITDEIFGRRTLIVETNTDVIVRRAQSTPKSRELERTYPEAGKDIV
jgi:hypothetical protein